MHKYFDIILSVLIIIGSSMVLRELLEPPNSRLTKTIIVIGFVIIISILLSCLLIEVRLLNN